jgi:type II secretory pathway component GspD/PulD (secretin)
MRRIITSLLLCSALALTAADTGKTFETYSILTPHADSLVQMAQAVGGTDSKVVFDKSSGKLMVYASPEVHATIKRLLEDINTLPNNIMLEVAVHEAGKAREAAASLGINASVAIDSSGPSGSITASPSASARSTKSDVMTSQKLLLQSGSEALIAVGKEVPFLDYFLVLGRNWGYIQQEVSIAKVGASLRVRAAVVGNTDLIAVTLTPELSGLVGNRITQIRYTNVATTVTVKNGETITIGSFGNNTAFYSKFLAGFTGGDDSQTVNITLSANIIDSSGRMK